MSIGQDGTKAPGPIKAKVSKGHCKICYQDITPGQVYYPGVGGTNTKEQGNAHKSCYDPAR